MYFIVFLNSIFVLIQFISQIYCNKIMIKDLKVDECREKPYISDEDIFYEGERDIVSERNKRNVDNCENFNITLRINPDLSRKSIYVHFESIPENSTCYEYYQVHLLKKIFVKNRDLRLDLVCYMFVYQNQAALEFQNIDDGIYQVHVVPCNLECEFAFSSYNVDIYDKSLALMNSPSVKNQNEFHPAKKIALFSIPILSFMFIFGIFLYRKYKSDVQYSTGIHYVISDDSSVEEYYQESSSHIDILILYSHDAVTKKKVNLLRDFLHNCANFKVTLMDDEIDEILINPHCWLTKQLQYNCSHLGDHVDSNKRIILVEPEKAISPQYIQNHLIEDEVEEDIYRCAIHTLYNDWKKCLSDYCHLFVIQFDETVIENKICQEFVPGTRYIIPQHLLDLCFSLSACEESKRSSFYYKLSHCLKTHEIVKMK